MINNMKHTLALSITSTSASNNLLCLSAGCMTETPNRGWVQTIPGGWGGGASGPSWQGQGRQGGKTKYDLPL